MAAASLRWKAGAAGLWRPVRTAARCPCPSRASGATVTGWPRPDRSFAPDLGVSGFVFNGQVVALKDGKHLTTLYGYFKGDKQYSLVAAESANGVQWTIRSVVADHKCGLPMAQNEGPCEAALCRLADGRLMCIFRLGSGLPYGQVWSGDEAKTWTKPVAMTGVYSVEPSLVVLNDGTVALSGGRPGLALWFNTDGTGKGWQKIDTQAHHNACRPRAPVRQTSSYTELVALDDTHLLYIYDSVPHGWSPIPESATSDYNSVWVVRITVEKATSP